MSVATHEDEYIQELQISGKTAIWVAVLSNGETVYQDDNRPGAEPPSAWLRLAAYVAEHDLQIEKLWLKFRSNIRPDILAERSDAYFFCKMALGNLSSPGKTQNFMLLGALTEGKLMVQRWRVPELHLEEVAERPLSTTSRECLIFNGKETSRPVPEQMGASPT